MSPSPAVAEPSANRPNIVLITTDDMADYDLRWMPRTRRLVGSRGVNLRGFISPHPLCCPARAEILTGQYAQNNGVRHNKGPFGGFAAHDPNHTIGTWLQASGYKTAFVGKYLNHYYARHGRVPGWNVFNPSIKGTYRPYGFTMYNNGSPVQYDDVYTADLVDRMTRRYIRRFASGDKPFFVWSSQIAPHGMKVDGRWVPPIPAKRHEGLFSDALPPSLDDPAFNERNVSDKPGYVRAEKGVRVRKAKRLFRQRIRSLQAVDEAVAKTVRALRRAGVLDNTLILFTSDNGYQIGEHRLLGKNYPYDQSLQVPFLVRGPGVPAGVVRSQMVSMVDVAPTVLDAADATADLPVDGRTLFPVIRRSAAPGYDTMLIQAGDAVAPWFFRGVRTKRYTWVRYQSGFEELYDRRSDPSELRNIAGTAKYLAVQAELERRFLLLAECQGADCRRDFARLPRLQG